MEFVKTTLDQPNTTYKSIKYNSFLLEVFIMGFAFDLEWYDALNNAEAERQREFEEFAETHDHSAAVAKEFANKYISILNNNVVGKVTLLKNLTALCEEYLPRESTDMCYNQVVTPVYDFTKYLGNQGRGLTKTIDFAKKVLIYKIFPEYTIFMPEYLDKCALERRRKELEDQAERQRALERLAKQTDNQPKKKKSIIIANM